MELFGKSFADPRPDDLEASLYVYKEEHQKAFEDRMANEEVIKSLQNDLSNLMEENHKVLKAAEKAKKKTEKAKIKRFAQMQLVRQEKLQAKRRLKEERIAFWPKKVYCVVVSLDTNSDMTPSSSRRESIDSLVKLALSSSAANLGSTEINLSISYITHSAFWSPRYDLSFTTPTQSGLITYRAEFCNRTSETWRDAKIILSTTQTSFQGLGEPIPKLVPWTICLSKAAGWNSVDGALLSVSERGHDRKEPVANSNKPQETRKALFGLPEDSGSDSVYNVYEQMFLLVKQRQKLQQQQMPHQQGSYEALPQIQQQQTQPYEIRHRPMWH